ncbi:MAG: hypothetical protein OXC09_05790 [Truepera sp.]|nr:hypothetical protein [Truepera sp.]
MVDFQEPPNWVAKRGECNLELIFEVLSQVVTRDVAEANKLPAESRQGFQFKVERNGEGITPMLRVSRFVGGNPAAPDRYHVTFEKSVLTIRVHRPPSTPLLARPEWDDEAQSCRLYIDERPYKVWEVSQRVLGPLFFEIPGKE